MKITDLKQIKSHVVVNDSFVEMHHEAWWSLKHHTPFFFFFPLQSWPFFIFNK